MKHIVESQERAGDRLREHRLYDDAVQRYRDALDVEIMNAEVRRRISRKLASALTMSRNPDAGYAWYSKLLKSYQSQHWEEEEVMALLVNFWHQLWMTGKTNIALQNIDEALRFSESQRSFKLMKRIVIYKTNVFVLLNRYDEAARCLSGVEIDPKKDSNDMLASYWQQKGNIDAIFGRKEASYASFEKALAILLDTPQLEIRSAAVWSEYARAAKLLGDTSLAKTYYERALLMARRSNVARLILRQCLVYAQLLYRTGELELAHEYLLSALFYDVEGAQVDRDFVSIGIPLSLGVQNTVTLARCNRPQAIANAFASGESGPIGEVCAAFARLYIEQRNLLGARRLLHRAIYAMQEIGDAWDIPLLIAQYGLKSDIPRARQIIEHQADRPCSTVSDANLSLFDALVAQRERRLDQAHFYAEIAIGRFEELEWYAYADLARKILPGERGLSPVHKGHRKPFADMGDILTDREREVASFVLKGLTNRIIAQAFNIKERTVETHMTSIMSKLGVRSRYQLIEHFAGSTE